MIDRDKLTDAQRRAAIERIGDNLALRSGAGCGKTLVLTRRFAELLLASRGDESPLERLAAVTFTEKAAMEMTSRVRRLLSDYAAKAKSETDRRKWRRWVQELPEARISTIHSFCARLLRTRAIEAGLDPGFAVCADELLAGRLRSDAAEQAVLSAVERQRQDALELLDVLTFDAAVAGVRYLLATRTARRDADYADAEQVLTRWRELAERKRREILAELRSDDELIRAAEAVPTFSCGDPDDKLAPAHRAATKFAEQLATGDAGPTGDAARAAAEVKLTGGRKGAWGGKEAKSDLVESLKLIREAARRWAPVADGPGESDEFAAKTLVTLIRLAADADAIYSEQKRRRGLLDFDDLLLAANKLLTENPQLTERLRAGIDQLLLDEAQDTGSLEVELLKTLVSGGDGRLFLVGDDKQSIYRFRGAQVEVFRNWCGELGKDRLEDLDLSFRTHPAGVAFVNHLFERLMGDGYSPIEAHRAESPPHPSVEVVLATGDEGAPIDNAVDAWRAQADAVAERIREMLDNKEPLVANDAGDGWRPVKQGDIALLLTRMTNTAGLERALAERGIDYYVVAGSGFFVRQEVRDLLSVLRAIDNPLDDVALAGVLRSELAGLDDESLLHIAESSRSPYFPALVRDGAPRQMGEAASAACDKTVAMIADLHPRKDTVGIGELLEEVLEATGLEATLLSRFQGRRMAGNIRRVVEIARQATASGLSLAEFVAQMSEQSAEESRYEQAAVSGEQEDVVRLMTVHKAKGLEFPVVFLPDLNQGRRGPGGLILNRLDWGLTLKCTPPGDDDAGEPVAYRLAKEAEAEDQQAEDVRTLYVAATRHQDHLVFVGADWRAKDGSFRQGGSTLAQLDEVFGLSAAADEDRERIPYSGGYELAIRRQARQPARRRARAQSPGDEILGAASGPGDVAAAMVSAAGESAGPPLLGPLPEDVGRVELAVTALNDFLRCPMLYRLRYELRTPPPARPEGGAPQRLDALTLGTLYHRAMELVDFSDPQAPRALVARAVAEMDLEDRADVDALAGDLERMFAALGGTDLWRSLASAERLFRELDFVMDVGAAVLRGQIDLLARCDGRWRVVDYKSDRVADEDLAEHSAVYELQMLSYAIAVRRQIGELPGSVQLVFLRTAQTHEFEITDAKLAQAEARITETARRLIAARRHGRFEQGRPELCRWCPYERLCR